MFLSKSRHNRIPYTLLCLNTLEFFGTWAYALFPSTLDRWAIWRFALIVGGIYLFTIYAYAEANSDFPILHIVWTIADLWAVVGILFALCALLSWSFPPLTHSLLSDIFMIHMVISLISTVCVIGIFQLMGRAC